MVAQYVDPRVSRTKFDRELAEYRANESLYRSRGWILADAEFPRVLIVLCAASLKPPSVITGVSFDFSNYDADPPSVRLVNPFTGEPFTSGNLPTVLKRRAVSALPPGMSLPPGLPVQIAQMVSDQPLMQWYGPDDVPFLCVAGVREYHEHPAHSGDSWALHRPTGAGRLVRLLELIDTYGVRPITGYNVELVPQVTGFVQGAPPE